MQTKYATPSRYNQRGFTIVELLIVIVVIGILAAITIVAYNGMQSKTRNAARVTEAVQTSKLLSAYKAINGSFPTIGSGAAAVCIGSGFPDFISDGLPDCWDVRIPNATYHPDNTFNTALQTVGSLPPGNRTVVEYPFDGNGFLGPVYVTAGGPGSIGPAYVRFFQEGTICPSSSRNVWTGNGGSPVSCAIDLQ